MNLPQDHVVVLAPDGVSHARVRDVRVLLCGRPVPDGAREGAATDEVDCRECLHEAVLRGDRAVGVVDA